MSWIFELIKALLAPLSKDKEMEPENNVLNFPGIYKYFRRNEILHGRDKEYPLSPELEDNLKQLLIRLNKFRELYNKPMIVSSGYRPGPYNTKVGGSKNSAHLYVMACDFRDIDGDIKNFINKYPSVLEDCNLYMEDPSRTPTWVHLDIRPRKNRIFIP